MDKPKVFAYGLSAYKTKDGYINIFDGAAKRIVYRKYSPRTKTTELYRYILTYKGWAATAGRKEGNYL